MLLAFSAVELTLQEPCCVRLRLDPLHLPAASPRGGACLSSLGPDLAALRLRKGGRIHPPVDRPGSTCLSEALGLVLVPNFRQGRKRLVGC